MSLEPMSPDEVRARLARLQSDDLPTHGGRTLAYVYDGGLADVDRLGREAVAAYAATNGLDPTAFPSVLTLENEVVGRTCDLLDAPASTVGTVTSGGTESVLLAVQGARDARGDLREAGVRPRMVLPSTIHAAFLKAAHYYDVEAVVVPVGADFRADVDAMRAAVEADPHRTVLVAVSAPSYAHGVVDPVAEVAAVAAAHGVRCHVDACIGGWVLPYARRLGRAVPPWTFEVEGVTSISVDLHKYAYAPKGTSVLLHRTPALRRPQYFANADWPGYTMLNTTLQSTKSGGPLAGAWAVLNAIGDDGYLDLTRRVLDGVDTVVAAVRDLDGLALVAPPDSTLLALAADGSCDVFTVADELAELDWLAQPQLTHAGRPPTLHLSLSAATDATGLVAALRTAVAAARERGPVRIDPDVVAFVAALDPATLGDEELDGLLAALGLAAGADGGAPALPERMGEVNALLDLASPRLREALLTAFLDRLARPVRLAPADPAESGG
ncbi:aminotransferase class V-fold PLP-dependent enzyme [Nocardioides zeae]|uniref:Aminotransferase class V-fold PLP-dependent enzyme n=1 Tax=Nocardioides imazamoxiresistens TaxID=3231893 RepID=A0ABU3PY59_9ACTN|nr:aminotransferase class V-fold PLP-dependent enzyme [Nocardioides zeae]MDT9594182.1 aminotransferase class V-fold PLP-dependent enzyme [Nocardioides zeae]